MPRQRQHTRMLLGLLALGLLAGVALTAGPAQAFVSGPGPLYPKPAWDQKKGAGRFVVLTNWASAAVLDKETGLVWERSPSPTIQTWSSARFACADKTVGNRKGWRLPSMPELASLVDVTQSNPTLPVSHPFIGVQTDLPYWSATASAEFPSHAWFVAFSGAGGASSTDKGFSFFVWCVRGGMNADEH